MRPTPRLLALRVVVLVALAFSGALLADYLAMDPAFCSPGSGCGAVRRSGFGYLPFAGSHVPVPALGLAGFGALFVVSLAPARALPRGALALVAAVGGLAGLALLAVQLFVIGELCWMCAVVDVAGIVAAAVALAPGPTDAPPRDPFAGWAWIGLAALLAGAPLLWARWRPEPELPAGIRAVHQPGKVNVVEFADFQCPFCRRLHPRLKALVADRGDVHFQRRHFPLDSHPGARPAARAALCAEAQGKGEPMADALFEAESLTPAGNRAIALRLGVDAARYDACLVDPATDARIDADRRLLLEAGLLGLPTTYVGERRLVGAQPDEAFRDALEVASRPGVSSGVGAAPFALLVFGAGVGLLFAGRRRAAPLATSAW